MPLKLACRKCGGDLEVPDDVVKEALETGTPLSIEHGVCPSDVKEEDFRHFKVRIEVFEFASKEDRSDDMFGEKMGSTGGNVSAANFVLAIPELLKELNKGWDKIVEMAAVIDEDPPFAGAPDTLPPAHETVEKPSKPSGLILP